MAEEPEEDVVDGEAVEIDPPESVHAQELVIREERAGAPAPASALPTAIEWEASMAIAREIAGTQFVPESYRGRPDAVVAAILTGREMGIGPMQALRQIHMIDGRPTFAADLMLAKMRQGGVMIVTSDVSSEGAWITAKRKDTGEECEVSFTVEDANSAGLLGKRNWQNYRQDMFWARAVGRLARRLGSDLLGGLVYTKEEMEDVGGDGFSGSAYGDSGSYSASATRKEFDAETDLIEGGVKPGDAAKVLIEIDGTVEWGQVLEQVVPGWRSLEGAERDDFWRRAANAATWLGNEVPPGSVPPPTEEQVAVAFAAAFSGTKVDVIYKDATAQPEVGAPQSELISAEQGKEIDALPDDVSFEPPGDVKV